jgi:hypothetical protein
MHQPTFLRRLSPALAIGIGIAVVLATGGAEAATGGKLVLGHANAAGAPTRLTNTGAGPALRLATNKKSTPNLAVSNDARIRHLNADELDGLSSSAFQKVVTRALALSPDAAATKHGLLMIPGLGVLQVSCSTTDASLFFAKSPSVAGVDIFDERTYDPSGGGTADTVDTLGTFAVTSELLTFAPSAGAGSKARYVLQLTGGSRVFTATVSLTSQDDNVAPGKCLALGTLE